MDGRLAVFMCNLKPAKMRGILSEGMIMCASSPERVEILLTPPGAAIGDRVFAQGYTGVFGCFVCICVYLSTFWDSSI